MQIKPWFNTGYIKILYAGKQAKLKWLQDKAK
jgi:hypothetical protein